MKKAQSQKVVVVLLCAVVFIVVFVQFSWKARADTLSQAAAVRVATQAKQGDLVAAKKAKTEEEANHAALAAAQAILPLNADAQSVIRHLTQLAITSNVSWENVTLGVPAAPTAEGGLQSVPITISIAGTIENIEAYLANIRGADVGRIIVVDGLTTSFSADALQPGLVTAGLSLRVFMYGVDTTATTVAPAAATNTVTSTPVGTVPTAVTDPTNVGATPTTLAPQG
jgi:Tfp pilus assembly protein PilO